MMYLHHNNVNKERKERIGALPAPTTTPIPPTTTSTSTYK